jgi:acyl dehydratase
MPQTVVQCAYTRDDVQAFARAISYPADSGVPPTFPIRLMTQAMAPFMGDLEAVVRDHNVKLVHASQSIAIIHPLPVHGPLTATLTASDIPKDPTKDRRLSVTVEASDSDGRALATLKSGLMLLPALPTGGKPAGDREGPDPVEVRFHDAMLRAYAEASLDDNPIHTDPAAARVLGLDRCVVQGMLTLGCVTSVAATRFAGTPITAVDALFLSPVLSGDTVRISIDEPTGGKSRYAVARGDGTLVAAGSLRFGN